MAKDKAVGFSMMAGSAVGILVFGWLIFFAEWRIFVLESIVFFAVAALLAIAGWIGYTLASSSTKSNSKNPESLPLEKGGRKVE